MSDISNNIRSYFENLPTYVDNPFTFRDDESVIELGLIDSFAILELITYLAETFNIQIEEDDMEQKNFDSIQAIEQFIKRKLSNEKSSAFF